ncbi:MAG: DUF1573 domain-containing protein [Phycisphaerales bacterium]|nr:MAG: DUF1573 domain-containing protein [Phycisphaerales bacterium]
MIARLACMLLIVASGAVAAQTPAAGARKKTEDAPEKSKGVPKIYSPTPVLDLGTITQGEEASGKFVIENRGGAELKIERVRASCGCTTVKLTEDQKTIPPGGKIEVTAKFNSRGRSGKQKKTVTVTSNDPSTKSLRLGLEAFIETLITVKPSRLLNIQRVRPGDAIKQHIDLIPGTGAKTLDVTSVKLNTDKINFTQEPLTDGDKTGVRFRFSVDEAAGLGIVQSALIVEAKVGEKTAKQTITVRGRVEGDLTFIPSVIQMSEPTVRESALQSVDIRATDGNPFAILGADAGPHIQASVAHRTDPRKAQITMVLSDSAPEGPLGALLEIRTTKVSQPVIRIPVFVNVAPRVSVSPPAVLLMTGASPADASRKVLLSTDRGFPLAVSGVVSDSPFVIAEVMDDKTARKGRPAVGITLNGDVPPGVHQAVVTIATDVKGVGEVRVPVTVIDPSHAKGPPGTTMTPAKSARTAGTGTRSGRRTPARGAGP